MRAALGCFSRATSRGIAGIHGSAPTRNRYRAWFRVQQWCPAASNCQSDDQVSSLSDLAPVRRLTMKSREGAPKFQDETTAVKLDIVAHSTPLAPVDNGRLYSLPSASPATYLGLPKNNTYPSGSRISNPRRPSCVSSSGALNAAPRSANSAASASGSGA
jgi:hypothetical protein